MDLTKAHRLLHKIQAFLDNGNGQELSRLEKDLIKSYILQLYDAVTMEEAPVTHESHKPADTYETKKWKEESLPKVEVPVTKPVETPKHETYKPEPIKQEYTPPVYKEYTPPVQKEKPVEIETPAADLKWNEPKIESKPFQIHISEPEKVQTEFKKPVTPSGDAQENLQKLFDLQKSEDVSHRFGHVPIASIESAMGLNERIFTLNELFGGDKSMFDSTCSKLNALNSFSEARNLLINGPAKDYKWADPERIRMAEQFLRIVSRRYPKHN